MEVMSEIEEAFRKKERTFTSKDDLSSDNSDDDADTSFQPMFMTVSIEGENNIDSHGRDLQIIVASNPAMKQDSTTPLKSRELTKMPVVISFQSQTRYWVVTETKRRFLLQLGQGKPSEPFTCYKYRIPGVRGDSGLRRFFQYKDHYVCVRCVRDGPERKDRKLVLALKPASSFAVPLEEAPSNDKRLFHAFFDKRAKKWGIETCFKKGHLVHLDDDNLTLVASPNLEATSTSVWEVEKHKKH